jgi:chromosome segregation ATPase
VASKRDELSTQLSALAEKNVHLQEQVDHISGEQYDVTAAQHTRIEELLAREHEQAETISKLTQELEDYKHDCAGLWQHNEDLKQQLEAVAASFHAKEQEAQTSTPSEQSTLQTQVSELEHQLELLQQQLGEKDQALSAAQWEHAQWEHAANEATPSNDSPSPDEDKYVAHSCTLLVNEVSL